MWASPSVPIVLYIFPLEKNFVDLLYILKFYMKENKEGFKLRNYGSDYKPCWGSFYSEGPNTA
jgi:hypothetical protein